MINLFCKNKSASKNLARSEDDNKLYRLTLPEALGASAGAEIKSSVNIERCDQIACSSDLSRYECQAAGGQIYAGNGTVNNCHCPATCNSLSGEVCGD